MNQWETLHCHFHPDRIALERCEVCQKPLCAYCLYYTEEGQRMCIDHAEQAQQLGLKIEQPGLYTNQLIMAQAGAQRKLEREQTQGDERLYRGNSIDLTALLGMILGIISLGACFGMAYCLPFVAVLLSLMALFNAKKAFDPQRTRRLSLLGLLMPGLMVVVLVGCVWLIGFSPGSMVRVITINDLNSLNSPPTATPVPAGTQTATPTPTVTHTP